MNPELIQIGVVGRAHGVRGGLRIRLLDAASEVLEDLEEVRVGGRLYRIETISRDKEDYLLKLAGITDRDVAERMRGQAVEVLRSSLPEVEDDEVYVADLPGCDVVDLDGNPIGRVTSVLPGAGQDLLVIDRQGKEVLVPFVEPIVVSVDVAARRIVCDLPEGLLELYTADGGAP